MIKTNKLLKTRLTTALRATHKGKEQAAREVLHEVLESPPEDVENSVLLGQLCISLNEPVHAVESFSRAVVEQPDNPVFLSYLGEAYLNQGNSGQAEMFFRKSLEIRPDYVEALANLAACRINRNDFQEAVRLLEQVLPLRSKDSIILANLAVALSNLERYDEALEYARKSIKLFPQNPKVYDAVGNIYSQMGEQDEAIKYFMKAISLNNKMGVSYDGLARVKKFTNEDKPFVESLEKILKESMPAAQRAHLLFSLGKMYDDMADWDKSFEYYRQANLLEKSEFNIGQYYKLFSKIKKFFTKEFIVKAKQFGLGSELPVFVVGMPRSGSTLIEQIIASHPNAAAAGELFDIGNIQKKIFVSDDISMFMADCERALHKGEIKEYAEEYLGVLREYGNDAKRVVDKMPDNFFYIGLIKLMFPNSKIIHSIRNPLDTCLSCYFQNFQTVPWSFDLDMIAQKFIFYREVMEYWEKILPENSILDMHYENVVEDPETESHNIIDFIGLPWDDACLAFYKTERAVRTASMTQVRQPIYKTSKMRARNYAKHLTGVANKLQKYLPDDPEFRKEFGIRKKFLGIF